MPFGVIKALIVTEIDVFLPGGCVSTLGPSENDTASIRHWWVERDRDRDWNENLYLQNDRTSGHLMIRQAGRMVNIPLFQRTKREGPRP